MKSFNIESLWFVLGSGQGTFGLRLVDRESGVVSMWWATAEKIAVLHGRIHETLNLMLAPRKK